MRVVFKPAESSDRYFVMEVRNAGRHNMTHDQHLITRNEQDVWWFSEDSEFRHIWLAILQDEDEYYRVGFCMLREHFDNGRLYGTLAVHPEFQDRGIGTAIYKFMTTKADEVWLDIRTENIPSLRAAAKAGFRFYAGNDRIVTMVYRK